MHNDTETKRNPKLPYWTELWSILPGYVRYRHRLDDAYVLQASGFLWAKRWKATLLADRAPGIIPVYRTRYHASHGEDGYDVQYGAFCAINAKAMRSKHAFKAAKACRERMNLIESLAVSEQKTESA